MSFPVVRRMSAEIRFDPSILSEAGLSCVTNREPITTSARLLHIADEILDIDRDVLAVRIELDRMVVAVAVGVFHARLESAG